MYALRNVTIEGLQQLRARYTTISTADLNIVVVSGGVSSETDGVLSLVDERRGVLILVA